MGLSFAIYGAGAAESGRHIYRATRLTAEELVPLFEAREEDAASVGNQHRERLTTFREVLDYYEKGLRFSTDED